jgi:hypothetical protein
VARGSPERSECVVDPEPAGYLGTLNSVGHAFLGEWSVLHNPAIDYPHTRRLEEALVSDYRMTNYPPQVGGEVHIGGPLDANPELATEEAAGALGRDNAV